MGLPPAYKIFVVALDTTPTNDLILDNVISYMLNKESHNLDKKDNILKPNNDAFLVAQIILTASCPRHPVSKITCFKCEKRGHYQFNCTNIILVSYKNKAADVVSDKKNNSF